MKGFIRGLAGSLFISLFLLLLVLSTLKFFILDSENLTGMLKKENAYSRIEKELSSEIRKNVKPPFTQEQIDQLPPEAREQYDRELGSIYNVFTEDRVQALLENNIQRIVAFTAGEEEMLYIYAPVREWGLPEGITSVEPLSRLSENTDIREILSYYSQGTGQENQFDAFLHNIQAFGSSVNKAWYSVLLLELFLLGLVIWLGGLHRGLRGLGIMFITLCVYLGVSSLVMSVGNSAIQNGMLGANPNLGTRIVDILLPPLLSQITQLWIISSIGSGVLGVMLIVASIIVNRKLNHSPAPVPVKSTSSPQSGKKGNSARPKKVS